MINLDTHIVVGIVTDELTARERRKLEADPRWGVCSIVFWELAMLVKKGRIDMDLKASDVRHTLGALHVWPITLDMAVASTKLDFNKDPADLLIAATSVTHKVPLMTRDTKIRKSKLVRFA
jgi:PIN domain nuclease of toxin-antitoxin system